MSNDTISATSDISVIAQYYMDDYLPRIVVYILLDAVTFIVNVLTVAAIVLYEQTRENYIVLIASLNLSDALVGLSMTLEPLRFRPELSVQIFTVLVSYLSLCISHWHTVALSIDRWIAIHYALNYHSIMSPFRLKLLVAAPWITGCAETLMCSLLLYLGGLSSHRRLKVIALITVMHLVIIYFINAIIYGRLWSVARRQRRQIAQLQQQQGNTTGVSKAAVMVMIIVGLFGLFWAPLIIINLLYFGTSDDVKLTRIFY